jgi:hypothetical protein
MYALDARVYVVHKMNSHACTLVEFTHKEWTLDVRMYID